MTDNFYYKFVLNISCDALWQAYALVLRAYSLRQEATQVWNPHIENFNLAPLDAASPSIA